MSDEVRRESLRDFVHLLAEGVRAGVVPREDLEILAQALESLGVQVSLPWREVHRGASLRVTSPKRCGKANCTRCPHGPYVILRREVDGRMRDVQLGRLGSPRVERRLREIGLDLPLPAGSGVGTQPTGQPQPAARLPRGFLHDD